MATYTTFDDIYYYHDSIHYRDMLLYYRDSGKFDYRPALVIIEAPCACTVEYLVKN